MNTRADVRAALATLLRTALVGLGLPVQAVYAYPPATTAGQSPIVYLSSAGSSRALLVLESPTFTAYLTITVLVLHTDGATWEPDDAEAALDDIDDRIADAIDANRKATAWTYLDYDGRSTVDLIAVDGAPYRREVVPVAATVLG